MVKTYIFIIVAITVGLVLDVVSVSKLDNEKINVTITELNTPYIDYSLKLNYEEKEYNYGY